jgi:voltage-gated potassium channel
VTPPLDRPRRRQLLGRLVFSLVLFAIVVAAGTLGYWWLWRDIGGTWLDALFMTVTTVTTIGYGEIRPLGSAGRLFTIALALSGIAVVFYTFGILMEYLVSSRLADASGRNRMEKRIAQLSEHVIVAGLGRVGRQAAEELAAARLPFVVVDPEADAVEHVLERGWLGLEGDATEDAVLEQAGIRRARGLIATTSNDAINMYIALSARVLNPALHIVSRAADEASVPKLIRAGANRAISPYAIGGHRLAHLIISPTVVDFFETALRRGDETLAIEDLQVGATSPVGGKSLDGLDVRRVTGATVLAVLRDGQPPISPSGDLTLQAGDHVLALGTQDQLRALERLIIGLT